MSPVSPRESPTPSSLDRSPPARHNRHRHRHHLSRKYDRHREREVASFGRSGREREEKHHSERKRRRLTYDVVATEGAAVDSVGVGEASERLLRRDCDYKSEETVKNELVALEDEEERQGKEQCRRDHRRRSLEKEDEETIVKEKRSSSRKYFEEQETRCRSNRSQEEGFKRCRSESQHSQSRATLSNNENRSSPSAKQHLSSFVSTLLEPLLKEVTSDTELEEVLPVGILSGEMAKRSMLLLSDQPNKKVTSQLQQSQSQNQIHKAQGEQLKCEQPPDHATMTTATLRTAANNQAQKSIEEGDSRFDKFLSNLSERLQEKEQESESWGEKEIDFSDILTEDSSALRIAVCSATLKPKQLLESSLSTPWQRITDKGPDEVEEAIDTIRTETDISEDKEDLINLATLLSSSISRRFLSDQLVGELGKRGVSLASVSTNGAFAGPKASRSGMVSTIFEEVSWRQRLLGVIFT
ncbi:unnamed protein product [Hydatigera taeniaeformis]|uniref:Uncharacterized protein n=1 Tax=Hydatigena taeniaeformis TaxID=6205 RepID=A0A0R3WJ10_HYDTA|nr:unnamed protein product [Hydatigera taeniaeformis]